MTNSIMARTLIPGVAGYVALQRHIHEALREQHPEWIDANGDSPTCDFYESRLAELLSLSADSKPNRGESYVVTSRNPACLSCGALNVPDGSLLGRNSKKGGNFRKPGTVLPSSPA